MLKKGSKLFGIFHNKCPRCNEGDFFISGNPFNLKTFDKMQKECSVCGQTFMPETGFYYGAMFVSYALNVVLMVTLWVAIEVLKPHPLGLAWYLIPISAAFIIFMPLTFRIARLIWIHIFVKYKKHS